MRYLIPIAISALLFWAVTRFCRRQGLFDSGSMGIGQLFAVVLYAIAWVAPSLLMAAAIAWVH
jgi:hypothetical protein